MATLAQSSTAQESASGIRSSTRPARSLASLALTLVLAPVLEFLLVDFQVDLAEPGLQPLLHIEHGAVVDAWSDLLQEEPEQSGGRDVAYRFFHVLAKVAL